MQRLRDEKILHGFLIALVVGGAMIRLWLCFQHNPLEYLFSDPKRHWLNGERLLHPDFIGAGDPILYQAYVFVLRRLVGDNRYLVALACGLLSVLMPWTFYRAGRELGFSRNAAMGAWALITWTPSLFTIYHYIMAETLLLPLVGLSLWMTGRFMRKGDTEAWLLAVLCWALACLTKCTVAPLAVACLVYAWWTTSRHFGNAALGALICVLLLLPNAIRTYRYLGFAAPLGNAWITKIQHRSGAREITIEFGGTRRVFASPSVAIQPLEPLSSWAIRRAWEESTINVRIDPTKGETDWRRSYRSVNVGAKEQILQFMENVLLFLFSPSWPDGKRYEWDGWLTHHLRWLWSPLIFFVFDCNVREFWRWRFQLLPVAVTVFALFLAFQNVATAEGRYRKPLEPLLLLSLVGAMAPPQGVTRSDRQPSP